MKSSKSRDQRDIFYVSGLILLKNWTIKKNLHNLIYSALTDKSTSASWQSQFLGCLTETNIKHFVDYVGYHNNADGIGFVEGIEKMIKINIVKESVSLAFHTHVYLQRKLSKND